MKHQPHEPGGVVPDPLWFKQAVIYELPVRAFADSNADGVGDLRGLIGKLDYLHDLGITAVWLLPIYPSPGRDGGYDIADYTSIHPIYGGIGEFKRLLREAHRRGLRVITELVLNHTSADHAWFQRARRAPPGSRWRNFYVWSDTPDRYPDARIIFKDFESSNWAWDPIARSYYWHRFYSHQPDLNYDNPEVHEAMFKVVDFWLELGVDGLRLDAVPYLYERDGTSGENLPETHQFLKRLRARVDSRFRDRMLLAEANQWPIDAAAYFGEGDECHMNFHFPLMPRMFMAVQLEDRFPIVDVLRQTPAIPDACQWATFLRNHDELTLEMVTDEERDYMYGVYAKDPSARINLGIRRRLAPLLKSRRTIELMTGLLLALPGTPVLYYGDEIGMGDNIYLGDRDALRTPMQWSADRNAGFSRASPQRLYLPVINDREYHYEAVNVEAQQANPWSLLWWVKRLISHRKANRVFGAGAIEFLQVENPKVLAFVRSLGEDRVLVVANLSRHAQHCELHLGALEGRVPVEMFGQVRFPVVLRTPYFLSLGPHALHWFSFDRPAEAALGVTPPPRFPEAASLPALLDGEGGAEILADFAARQRWFQGRHGIRRSARILDAIDLGGARPGEWSLVFVEIEFEEGDPEIYVLAPAFAAGDGSGAPEGRPQALIALARVAGVHGVVYDALATGAAAAPLADLAVARRRVAGSAGVLATAASPTLTVTVRPAAGEPPLLAHAVASGASNSVFSIGDRILIKVFRHLQIGVHPELEIGTFLSAQKRERCAPRLLGAFQYRPRGGETAAVGAIFEFIPHQQSAWELTLDALERHAEQVLTSAGQRAPMLPSGMLTARCRQEPDEGTRDLIGRYLDQARTLGRRTALLHRTLASDPANPAFAPEPFDASHQQSIYQGARVRMARTLQRLRESVPSLPEEARAPSEAALAAEQAIDERLRAVTQRRFGIDRIRCHGGLHLGEVLLLGDEVRFIDFEGAPTPGRAHRSYKRCCLRDAVGMLRSFDHAAASSLRPGRQRAEDVTALAPWVGSWVDWVSAAYLGAYLAALDGTRLVPRSDADRDCLLDFYLIERCLHEIGDELSRRPTRIEVPLNGLLRVLAQPVT